MKNRCLNNKSYSIGNPDLFTKQTFIETTSYNHFNILITMTRNNLLDVFETFKGAMGGARI